MRTILICTVGGTHEPIIRAIKQNYPDFVHFICSDDSESAKGSYVQVTGEGKVLKSKSDLEKPDLPNIVVLTELSEDRYEVHKIKELDDLQTCYLEAVSLIEQIHRDYPHARIVVDYTGGTKSMSAGLAAAALDDGRCEIQLVTGIRADLQKVARKTESVRPARVWDVQAKRRMNLAKEFMKRYDFSGAERLLEETLARFVGDKTKDTLQRWLTLCRAFDAWDRFDHQTASILLKPYRKDFVEYCKFLDSILLGEAAHGFELVEDLILNAERRAVQGRFDDAIGRLYRALELTAQRWLELKYGIKTSDVDLQKVPPESRANLERYRNDKGQIQIGLWRAWELIGEMGQSDPLGDLFTQHRSRLLDFLKLRNQSLFAHGTSPIEEGNFRNCERLLSDFLYGAIDRAVSSLGKKRTTRLAQFPTEMREMC